MDTSHSELSKSPESVVVFTRDEAMFMCQSNDAQGFGWRVNGTSEIAANFAITIVMRISTITIPALPEYNGTLVQCVAFGNTNVESENVTMTIQGERVRLNSYQYYL